MLPSPHNARIGCLYARPSDESQGAVPGSLETISSGGPVLAVLEINGGMASRLKIRTGDRVLHPAFGGDR